MDEDSTTDSSWRWRHGLLEYDEGIVSSMTTNHYIYHDNRILHPHITAKESLGVGGGTSWSTSSTS